jgi:transposase
LAEWAAIDVLSDEELGTRLCPPVLPKTSPPADKERPKPDWPAVHEELRRPGVTLMLLWTEYKAQHPGGYGYTRYTELYSAWKQSIALSMRQLHRGGGKAFVDFSGKRFSITNAKTGATSPAEMFVGVLGASSYSYVCATPSQSIEHWIDCHQRMLAYFGGVPAELVPDNLKSGIRKPDRYEAEPNATYREMAAHYGTCIIPARIYRPRDKAKAEAGVQVAQRWILASLRDRAFYSLAELNDAIAVQLERLNTRVMRHLGKSRRDLWQALDVPALKPLPARPYEYAEWKRVRLNIDYHLEFDAHYYSAPYTLIRKELLVRATRSTIEVLHNHKRVASHVRSYRARGMTTCREHMPDGHRAYAEWTPERVIAWGKTVGSNTALMIEKLLDRKSCKPQGFRSAQGIISLAKTYGAARVEKAALKALQLGALNYRFMKNTLANGMEDIALNVTSPEIEEQERQQLLMRQTDLLAAENIRGGKYYH